MNILSKFVTSLSRVRMGIKARLAIGFGLVLALLAGTTTIALVQVQALGEQIYNIVEVNNERSAQATLMFDAVTDGYTRLLCAALMEDSEDIQDQIAARTKMVAQYVQAQGAPRADVSKASSGAALLKQLDVIDELAAEGNATSDALAQIVKDAARHQTAAAVATNRLKVTTEEWLKEIRGLIALNNADNAVAVQR